MKQLNLLKNENSAYGGVLMKTRKGRARPRPLSTRETLHLVLRSTKAKGGWSFAKTQNRKKIDELLRRFAKKYGVKVLSYANVGNHLHFHVKLSNRYLYAPFIRALTGAIAMAITGASRWKPGKSRFWDYRPFTRVVKSFRAFLNLKDYIRINRLEGCGYSRSQARFVVSSKPARAYDTS
jgi:REP element-mobilizing transposase RayT